MYDPLLLWVQAGNPLARVRILDVAQAVPDQTTDIELVIEDAGAAILVSVNGRWPLGPAAGTFALLGIEKMCDGPWRLTVRIEGEDPAHDVCLGLIYIAVSANGLPHGVCFANDVVAEGIAATGLPQFDASPQSATRLVGQILQEHRIHCTL